MLCGSGATVAAAVVVGGGGVVVPTRDDTATTIHIDTIVARREGNGHCDCQAETCKPQSSAWSISFVVSYKCSVASQGKDGVVVVVVFVVSSWSYSPTTIQVLVRLVLREYRSNCDVWATEDPTSRRWRRQLVLLILARNTKRK